MGGGLQEADGGMALLDRSAFVAGFLCGGTEHEPASAIEDTVDFSLPGIKVSLLQMLSCEVGFRGVQGLPVDTVLSGGGCYVL